MVLPLKDRIEPFAETAFSEGEDRRMMTRSATQRLLLCALLSLGPLASARAATPQPGHWVGTWATAPYAIPNADATFGTSDMTLRQIVHVSLGGSRVRIVLSNEFGLDPLTIGAAHIALSAGGSEIALASANALTFSGKSSITIPPGAVALSDPADLKLPALSNLAVSIFLPAQSMQQLTAHNFAAQTNYMAPGNLVSEKTLENTTKFTTWNFLTSVDILASANDGAIVAFGDSITDGALSTYDTNSRWPDVLARRLQADKKTAGLSVLNEGIGGNRVLHDSAGPSALSRFNRDVLAQAGVKYLIIMESINDIGNATSPTAPKDPVTADEIIAGLQQLVERAHIQGIKVFGATLTPYVGAKYQSPAGETMRTTVNDWIRSYKGLDGVIDFDLATRDSSNPSVFSKIADSGDHLHPGDAGYKVMGESIDLKLFGGK
jgi:lysophospholipase L1-like esterase